METTQTALKARESSKTKTALEEKSILEDARNEDVQLIEKYRLLELQMIKRSSCLQKIIEYRKQLTYLKEERYDSKYYRNIESKTKTEEEACQIQTDRISHILTESMKQTAKELGNMLQSSNGNNQSETLKIKLMEHEVNRMRAELSKIRRHIVLHKIYKEHQIHQIKLLIKQKNRVTKSRRDTAMNDNKKVLTTNILVRDLIQGDGKISNKLR